MNRNSDLFLSGTIVLPSGRTSLGSPSRGPCFFFSILKEEARGHASDPDNVLTRNKSEFS